jgi:Leucine-rich repeat (LRR) protein
VTGWEAAAFVAGRAVARRAAVVWLSDRRDAAERSKDLSELVALRISDRFHRRSLERQVEEIADRVAQRLEPLCQHEFYGLGDNDRTAVLRAVVDAFATADLSDEALFAADMDPAKLAEQVRAALPTGGSAVGLGEPATRFLDLVLDECCDCFVRVVIQLAAFGPRASVEMLDRISRLGEQVSLVLARLPARQVGAGTGAEQDRDFEHRYLELVSDRLDELELFGIDVRRYRPRTTLNVAYISLTVTSSADNRIHPRARRTGGYAGLESVAGWRTPDSARQPDTVRVETALAAGPRMLVRGEAGSGKTTLLAWLAVTAARGRFTGPLRTWNGCVPFLVKLRSHADAPLPPPEHFLDDVALPIAGLMPSGWAHRLLDAGRVLLLVDGVDELPAGKRRAVRDWLVGVAVAYPKARILVTSRSAAAAADWLADDGFAAVILEPMGPTDVRALIRHWHDAVRDAGNLPCDPGDLPRYEGKLLAELDAAAHLRTLAASPLLCAMLCALNLDRRTHLPPDRMSLYAAAVSLLLERRDAERGVPRTDLSLSARDKIYLLQDLAWWLSLNNRAELPIGQAIDHLARKLAALPHVTAQPGEVLAHLLVRSGVIREPMVGRIDFIHRTIQEYLAAKEVAEAGHVGLLLDRAHIDQWRNVVVMSAGHSNRPLRTQLVEGLLDRADQQPRHARQLGLLAASCLETAPTLPPDLLARVNDRLAALLPPTSIRETRSLGSVGTPVLRRLPRNPTGLSEAAAAATVRTVALINGHEALTFLANYAVDPRPRVQQELARAWQYFDPHDYAREVLANAPLVKGTLDVTAPALLSAVHHLGNLRSLRVTLAGVGELSCLRDVPALTDLNIHDAPAVDLSPLANHTKLQHLFVGSVGRVDGVAALAGLHQLRTLQLIPDEPLDSIAFLGDLQNLWFLQLGGLTEITNLSTVAGLSQLQYLDLIDNPRPPGPPILRGLKKLDELGAVNSGQVQELSALVDSLIELPNLVSLILRECRELTDLKPLTRLQLTRLQIIHAPSLGDITPLARLVNLRELWLVGAPVDDITALAELPSLQVMDLSTCPALRNLASLAELPRLRRLYLRGAAAGLDLSPLAGRRGLQIWLDAGQDVRGLGDLGPGVRIRRY